MKFGQLIKHNVRNIFLEKSYTKYSGEASPRPFYKKQNWEHLLVNSQKCYKCYSFNCMYKSKLPDYIKINVPTTCFYLKRPGDSLSAYSFRLTFCMILMLYSINWPNFIACLFLLLEILGNTCIVIICNPVCDVINFEISLSFLIKPFSYLTKKSGQKCKYLEKEKTFSKK